jgi:glycosyltransferase AglD
VWQKQSNGQENMKNNLVKIAFRTISIILIVAFFFLSYHYFDFHMLLSHIVNILKQPDKLLLMFLMYGSSFLLRAFAWKWYVNKNIPFQTYMNGLLMSLFINHLAPIKMGDVVRIGILAKQQNVTADEALHSVAVLRMLDIFVLLVFAGCGVYYYFGEIAFQNNVWILFGLCGIGMVFFMLLQKWKPEFVMKHINMMKQALLGRNSILIIGAVFLSWMFEAIVVYEMAKIIRFPLSMLQSIWVNSITVAGQVFQIAPGGLTTYEAVMVFSLTRILPMWEEAYTIAVLTHSFKFIFSYLAGIFVLLTNPQDVMFIRSLLQKKRVREE